MPNEVVILVTSRNEVRKGFEAARKDVETFANDSADLYQERFAKRMENLGRNLTTPLANSGKEMGERLGNSSAGEITRVIGQRVSATLPDAVSRALLNNGGIALYRSAGDSIGQEVGDSAGDTAGRTMSDRITDHLTRRISTKIRTVGDDISGDSAHAGERIGEDISKTIHTKITDKIKTSVDIDTNSSLLGKASKFGESVGDRMSGGLGNAMQAFFSGDLISVLVKALSVGALATALAPVLGAAITSAILLGVGGGVLTAGIVAAFKDPQVAAAGGDLKKVVGDAFAEFGKPFRVPVVETMEKLAAFVKSLAPDFKRLGDTFAPIVGELGTGLVSLLQNATPGILAAAEAAAPLFETLAKHMPAIGDAIGEFFEQIAAQGDDANLLFGDLLSLIEKLIPVIGGLISFLTSAYGFVHNFVTGSIDLFNNLKNAWTRGIDIMKLGFYSLLNVALDVFGKILAGASSALSWIPGIGPKLKVAERKFNEFRKGVNNELNKVKDNLTIDIRFRTFGMATANAAIQAAQLIQSMGYAHGGIKGAASGMGTSGLTWVGERGPELVNLPSGSTVHSSGDSMRMMRQGMDSAGGGGGTLLVRPAPGSSRELMSVIIENLRYEIDRNGQGSVQRYLGNPSVA